MISRKKISAALISAIALTTLAISPSHAETFPNKPVRFLVGYSPGGSTDAVARLLAPELSKHLGQPVVVENRTGAGGAIALETVSTAQPDGHVIALCATGLTVQQFLPSPLAYDPDKLTPVAQVAELPYVIMVNSHSKFNSLEELIDYAKQNPGDITFASSGIGSGSHIAGEMFQQRTGIELLHVPFQGSGQAVADFIAGRIDLMFEQLVSAKPHINSGKAKPLAVAGHKSLPMLEGIKNTEEHGITDYSPIPWLGICTSDNVPEDRVNVLYEATIKALETPAIKERFAQDGVLVIGSTPKEFAEQLEKNKASWGPAIKSLNLQ